MSMDPVNFILSVFSGIGNKLFENKSEPSHFTIQNTIQIPESIKDDELDKNSEVSGIVKRLNIFKDLLNENENYDKYTIAKLAKIMELKSVGELERIFTGEVEPDFQFIEKFCDMFGLDEEWLTEGKHEPFYSSKQTYYDPVHYYSYIKEMNPERAYFIRSKSKYGEVFLLLKFNDWKYEVIQRCWHISSHVGSGGASQIYGMYKLINKLRKDDYGKCFGRVLDEKKFELLYFGKIFPGSIVNSSFQENSYWWDDFTDVNNQYSTTQSYESQYGEEFVRAQQIAKSYLVQEKQ